MTEGQKNRLKIWLDTWRSECCGDRHQERPSLCERKGTDECDAVYSEFQDLIEKS